MPKPAGHRNVATVTMSALSLVLLAACVALLGACSSPQHASTTPGTTPAVWTGSPAPAGVSGHEECRGAVGDLTTLLKGPDGAQVATAKFEFANGFATVTSRRPASACWRPVSTACTSTRWASANPTRLPRPVARPATSFPPAGTSRSGGHSGEPDSGDLTSLQVRSDGTGTLVTTTDAFTWPTCWPATRPRSSSTRVPTTSATSRRIATTRSTGRPVPTRPR